MPTPLPGFKLSDPQTNSLGWDITLPQQQPNAVALMNNESDRELTVWGDGLDYLGTLPAFMVYIPVVLPRVYSMLELRVLQQLYTQAPVTFYVNGSLYAVGETLPVTTPIALPRQFDTIRQQRTVSVPVSVSHFYNNTWSGSGTSVLANFSPTAQQLANGLCGIYLYYARRDCFFQASVTADLFAVYMQWKTAGGVAVGSPFDFVWGRTNVSTTQGDHWEFRPAQPLGAIGQIPATATNVDVGFRFLGGGALSSSIMIAAFMDPSNSWWGNAEIGFGNLWTPAAYEQAGKAFPFF